MMFRLPELLGLSETPYLGLQRLGTVVIFRVDQFHLVVGHIFKFFIKVSVKWFFLKEN